jgi:receptor protein-tyrosine kinase
VNTIDRLMGRLTGDRVPGGVAAPETGQRGRGARGQPAEGATAAPETETADRAAAEAAARPAAAAPAPAPAAVSPPRERPSAPPGRLLEVDLGRLAARGYLVPGRGADTMSEQYQQIKRRLLANINDPNAGFDAPANLIMITSSLPNEGKTFTSVNLALSLAMELDRTVLAVDTDVIKQDLTRTFGALGRPGLFDYLSRDDISLPDVICNTSVPKLALVPAGTERTTITERLASEAMRRLTLELAQRYADRIILFDCPPVLATTGATALAPYIGQIVLVVEAGRTSHDTLRHALQMLEHVRVTGLILNKVKETMTDGYQYYGYRYGYGYLTPSGKSG